jgi:hypothetical protein
LAGAVSTEVSDCLDGIIAKTRLTGPGFLHRAAVLKFAAHSTLVPPAQPALGRLPSGE